MLRRTYQTPHHGRAHTHSLDPKVCTPTSMRDRFITRSSKILGSPTSSFSQHISRHETSNRHTHTKHNTQHATHDAQHTKSNTQHVPRNATSSTQQATHNKKHTTHRHTIQTSHGHTSQARVHLDTGDVRQELEAQVAHDRQAGLIRCRLHHPENPIENNAQMKHNHCTNINRLLQQQPHASIRKHESTSIPAGDVEISTPASNKGLARFTTKL